MPIQNDIENRIDDVKAFDSALDQVAETAPSIGIDEIRKRVIEQKDIRGGFSIVEASTAPTRSEVEGKLLLQNDTTNTVYRLYARINTGWRLIGSSRHLEFVISSEAQGDTLYNNGTDWVNLAAGTDGQALTTQGASANPTWSGMTTQGDVEYHSGSDRARLAAGTDGQALTTQGASANPTWSGMTTQGDIEYHSGSDRARLAAGTDGQFLKTQGSGANPTWDSVSKLHIATTDVTITDSTTETDLISFTLPGGTLGTNNAIIGKIFTHVDSPDNRVVTWRTKLGSTTYNSPQTTHNSSSVEGYYEFWILGSGATNSQECSSTVLLMQDTDVSTNSSGTMRINYSHNVGTSTEDSTGDLTVAVSAQFDAGGSGNDIIMRHAIVWKIN